ncbi:putative membrane-bound serine protease (ClpP class) [Desulforapulum autotrophicum HRM2]|uniref:Membrane-bound serine protease (ClpP class) n=1 Tax=Desulforapulum autotrophicum (strain ATCC 43914 / DSM 3382 / VKM B-1955 / HRM2) TaxID=177437 RepID=C0QB80_DESAH|nr:NfeD family protein [Desulforapulum autotrophicum]ACN14879.1 putative membrane-bound serine protease (ClpP class) [Desulforapulum autotrophicum HRM2]
MSGLTVPIVLQLVGVAIIIAEIIIPSGGIISILAALVFGYSLYIAFTQFSPGTGMLFVLADMIIIPVLIYVGLRMIAKSPVTLNATLSKAKGVISQEPGLEGYLGKNGLSKTDLRPAGFAMIDGKRVDVVTRGEYISKQTPIVVHGVIGNQIIVRERVEK